MVRLRVRSRSFVGSCLVLALLIVGTGYGLKSVRDALIADRTEQLAKTVREGYLRVANYYQLAAGGDMAMARARQSALAALQEMRHASNDYFWVTDYDARFLMHPIKPELVGQLLPTLDPGSKTPLHGRLAVLLRQQGSGYLHYHWPKPGSAEPLAKVSYVIGFKPWGWGIGSGVYVDDIDRAFWVEVRTLGAIGLILLAVLALFWFGFRGDLLPRDQRTLFQQQRPTR
ncbi:cache domain-containing protein [Motiliproteus sp. SC1-56]|uniref:cache domain-containing protein n=1 Tax=Motiliproteus sp. SC1-56 TaxID=2799565 RepID=UPI001A90A96B|nr:cache domain-containing protein [Motiliproteus sp. SC1-56]